MAKAREHKAEKRRQSVLREIEDRRKKKEREGDEPPKQRAAT
jgi:hypothetical protein